MTDWEEEARKFGGVVVPAQPGGAIDWAAEAKKFGGVPAVPSVGEKLGAIIPGLRRGIQANLPGAPMDTLLNVADLSRAAYGASGRALGLLQPNQMPDLINRENVPFSSEANAKRIRDSGRGITIDNPHPEDWLSSMAYAAGQTAPMGVFGGGTAPTMMRNMGGAALAGATGEGVAQAGGGPEAQLLASVLVPSAVTDLSRMVNMSQRELAKLKITNQIRDESVRAMQRSGLVISPMEAAPNAPGVTNRIITALGQKQAIDQTASFANIGKVDDAARRALVLPTDAHLTTDTLRLVRKEAGVSGYAPIRALGRIPIDAQYLKDMMKLVSEYETIVGGSRSLASPLAKMAIQDALRPSWNANNAVNLISQLREKGFKNLSSSETQSNILGGYQKNVAQALDSLIGRHLKDAGNPGVYKNYLAARERIAQAHTIEDALNPATGHVDAVKLASAWQDGAPLTGPLLDVARAASTVRQSMQQVREGAGSGLGPMMGMGVAGGVASAVTGNPAYMATMAIPGARMAARSIALSPTYQKYMVHPQDYKPGRTSRLLSELFPEDIQHLLGAYAFPAQQ